MLSFLYWFVVKGKSVIIEPNTPTQFPLIYHSLRTNTKMTTLQTLCITGNLATGRERLI